MSLVKRIIFDTIYLVHLILIIFWFGLFLVPTSFWPNRIIFHFWFIFIFMLLQVGWGFILIPYMKKYRIVCPLTTLMQYLRGYSVSDKNNFNHSFVREFLASIKIKVPYGFVGTINFLSLIFIMIEYLTIH